MPPPGLLSSSGPVQVPPAPPMVIIISGPSGVGKDAVIKALQHARPSLHFVVTATSRQVPGLRQTGRFDVSGGACPFDIKSAVQTNEAKRRRRYRLYFCV